MEREHTKEEKALLDLLAHYEEKDRETHDQLARECAKFDYYWRGVQDLVWDPVGREWVSASGVLGSSNDVDVDPSILEKTINVYRAYGESVISALANTVPGVRFFPENAEDPADIATAKAYIDLSDKISRENDAELQFIHALYIMWNQHFVAGYNTHAWDEKFGTLTHEVLDVKEVEVQKQVCPDCGEEYPGEEEMESAQPMNGMGQVPPDPAMGMDPNMAPPPEMGMEPGMDPNMAGPPPSCPSCGSPNPPVFMEEVEEVPSVKETITNPKGREIIEVYGPRNVKVPPYIRDLDEAPYLILELELSGAYLGELYPKFLDAMVEESSEHGETSRDERENIYTFGPNNETRTLKRVWFRPWAFNVLQPEIRDKMKKKFPGGVLALIVDDHVLEFYDEDMDEHWNFCPDPLSHEIHGDPMGKPLVPIQDMINDIESLSYETILAGVPEIFADTEVLNFREYSKIEAKPNQVIPAKGKEGVGLANSFFQPHSANLSKEIGDFRGRQDQNAQFVTGAFPSIYGGQLKGDRTLGEYQQSRAQALQRLSLKWKMLNKWWARVIWRACESHRRNMEVDERFVKQEGDSYANVWIRAADMTGRVSDVFPEAADQFPMTWEQTRGVIMELLQTQDPFIMSVLQSPENIDEFSKIFSLTKFKVPGQEQRFKQKWEIAKMKKGEPVIVDQFLDDHQQHAMVLQSWAAGPEGREAQENEPQLYQAIMMHMQEHQMIIQQQMAAAQPPPEQGGQGGGDIQTETAGAAEPPADDTGAQ